MSLRVIRIAAWGLNFASAALAVTNFVFYALKGETLSLIVGISCSISAVFCFVLNLDTEKHYQRTRTPR